MMQNIDFYSGKNFNKQMSSPPNINENEYYSNFDDLHRRESDKNRKRASRMMSLIVGLCIVSFTAGLIIGIKFASRSSAQIVDDGTRKAVSDMKDRFTNIMVNSSVQKKNASDKKNIFPKEEYPFVIKLNNSFNEAQSQEIARFLSGRGHTVILSKYNSSYKIFVGPYKKQTAAESSIKKIKAYPKKDWFNGIQIVKR